jgi:hypothetical protein
MISMSDWVKVLTVPLGVVAFVLFLVFRSMGKMKGRQERRWMFTLLMLLSALTFAGCMVLEFLNTRNSTTKGPATHIQQTSSGPDSPNVNGVTGDVTITNGQNSPTGKEPKPPVKSQARNGKSN